MPDAGLSLSPDAMRQCALKTLASLVGGSFGEKMRIEAAACIIVTARMVAPLARNAEQEAGFIAEVATRWDTVAMTVYEFAETLRSAAVIALLDQAPGRAEAA